MKSSAVASVHHLIEDYRRFLRTSYRFLDPHLRAQFEAHLAQADVVVKGPYVTLSRDFMLGQTLQELVDAGSVELELLKAHWPFGDQPLYSHQVQALAAGRADHGFVVTTGTGSGKTESFLLPVLDGIVRRKRDGISGVQAVLLYPMNALANDQLERLRRLLRGTDLDISYALYTGDSDTANQRLGEEPAETERLTRAAIRRDPPDILLTNYKQLEFLLVRAEDRALFTPALKYLVLDEVHSYRGAQATEIACLIRRLKAHARLAPGELVGIATSATVASGDEARGRLADFAAVLFGEAFDADAIIGEAFVSRTPSPSPWAPPAPALADDALLDLDPNDEEVICQLAQQLTRRDCPPGPSLTNRLTRLLEGNLVVEMLETVFADPAPLAAAVQALKEKFPDRAAQADEQVQREVEAYLLLGSIGDDAHPPRLRPKLHTFFHGVYDVALCMNPACRALVPQGGTECLKCGSVARPAALCRTCGQDFVKLRFEKEDDAKPVGTGDFYSDEHTAFATHQIHKMPEGPGVDDEAGTDDEAPGVLELERRQDAESRLDRVGFCLGCGRVLGEDEHCPECNREAVTVLLHRGPLHTCPACGDVYTKGDIVAPLRTGTASSVSIIIERQLARLDEQDRKLLVFADNRQDVAHQAGYTADKHRSFALRHLSAHLVNEREEVYLQELPELVLEGYQKLGFVPRRLNKYEHRRWKEALTYEAANEFTRYARQRASLETLGLVGVEYDFLDEVAKDVTFTAAAEEAGLGPDMAINLVRACLDVMRRNRAVDYEFFQEYIDPNRKRRYRELESEPYNVRLPERDRAPKAFAVDRPDHIRKAGRLMGFFQENPRAGQLTAMQKVAARLIGDRGRSEAFLRAMVKVLRKYDILVPVPNFPIPKAEQLPGLQPLQLSHRVIHLVRTDRGFRCNACQTWRPYYLATCPTPRCGEGQLQPAVLDEDNFYVRLYLDQQPKRLAVREHSAQIPGDQRADIEREFKEGFLDVLVCSPTLELGVDIGPLLTVALRNVPPTPANYAQRVGRAGRRLRIGFASTFCAGGAHDRHGFEEPEWLVAGEFDPPRVRLDNPRIVERHLRSFLLEHLEQQLPSRLGDLLDDLRAPSRWERERIQDLLEEVTAKQSRLADQLAGLLAQDRDAGRVDRYDAEETSKLVGRFNEELTGILERWWQRVAQLKQEHEVYSQIGTPRQDKKKAAARERAYYEITQDRERAYMLNYLSTQGFLPAYQFPVDTFSLDPGVADTPTLYRASAIAIEEFAPGNFVYANGHKLKSIRVLFAGGPGAGEGTPGRSDAEAAGRLQSFQFCERCDEVVEETRNACPRCDAALPAAVDAVFVDAFEAEESLRIGADEESRQRQYHVRRESLLSSDDDECLLYPYPFAPVEYRKLAQLLVTNWGKSDSKTGEPHKFWLCPDCGRHQPYDPSNPAHQKSLDKWRENHAKYCSGEPVPLILGYKYTTDCLVLTVPSRDDTTTVGRWSFSPALVTLAEALLAGASDLLELEPFELAAFVRPAPEAGREEQIVIYETVPGGAGYVEEIAQRLPEVASAAQKRLYGHDCAKACYLCLKHYRNQRWHHFFNKDVIRDTLQDLALLEPVQPTVGQCGEASTILQNMLAEHERERPVDVNAATGTRRYPKGPIEEPLLAALLKIPDFPAPVRDYEIRDAEGRLITVPDFTWEQEKIAVYCDGYAYHGNPETLELDARKRNWLQSNGWAVLTFWGRTILKDPDGCAQQVGALYRQRAVKNERNN
ncbi:MAG TPA: DEAD/DEAH box helicase [Gammaproteobacteria bacterium]|nr:DEAD/DEAH box helicase [Gammaproteobacteria bacterium]